MAPLIFLGLGLLSGLTARALLVAAAFRTRVWWGLAVLLPFGPFFFRMCHSEACARSRVFGIATLPCIAMFYLLGPKGSYKNPVPDPVVSLRMIGYGALPVVDNSKIPVAPVAPNLDVEERRLVNAAEMQRITAWGAKLGLRKRDLLKSDAEGVHAFNDEVEQYNVALLQAQAEKNALASTK